MGHGLHPYTGAMLPPSVWSQSSAVLARHAPSRDTAFHLQGFWPALILVGVLTVLHMLWRLIGNHDLALRANHQGILQSVALPFIQGKLGMAAVVYSFTSELGMG